MFREPGLSVRLKLTLSYAAFLTLAGMLLLAAVWIFLLRYVPDQAILRVPDSNAMHGVFPVRSRLLHAFAPKAFAVFGALVVVGLLGGWFLAGRMLAPLQRITQAARTASTGSLSHRINLNGRSDEFRELADSFDNMLEQLEAHVGEHQRFAANASHELRTPLATTQALLDVARSDPNHDGKELLDRLALMNARAIDLTEALLLLSRAEHSFERERVDLSLAAEEAIETLLPLAERSGIGVTTATDVATVLGSPSLLFQLIMNLVHNAIVHNLGDGGHVWIAVASDTKTATLRIENTGTHLDRQLVETLHEPFRRGTDRIHSAQAGVGLGLAIAAKVISAHSGSLSLASRAEGGLTVVVKLPLVAPQV